MIFLFLNEMIPLNAWVLLGILINTGVGIIIGVALILASAKKHTGDDHSAVHRALIELSRTGDISNPDWDRAALYILIGTPAFLLLKLLKKLFP